MLKQGLKRKLAFVLLTQPYLPTHQLAGKPFSGILVTLYPVLIILPPLPTQHISMPTQASILSGWWLTTQIPVIRQMIPHSPLLFQTDQRLTSAILQSF